MQRVQSQQKVTSASLKASWVLAKELDTNKSMHYVIGSVKQMLLSARSIARCIEALSDAVQGAIIDSVSNAN